jgi:hypothetical protein
VATPQPSPSPILVELATSQASAPWWGVPVVAGLFLIIGAILGYIFNRANERRRELREDKRRFDEKILELSISLVSTSQEITLKAGSLNRIAKSGATDEWAKVRLEISELVKAAFAINGALFLLAPTPVSNYANALVERATKTFASTADEIPAATSMQNLALTDFVKQLRFAIGMDPQLQDRDPGYEDTEAKAQQGQPE